MSECLSSIYVRTKAERIMMASASSDISSGSAFVDTFVKRNPSSRSIPREYLMIRSVSETVSQFIPRNSLSFKLDDKTVKKEVKTFRDEDMKSSNKIAILSEAEVQVLEMLSTRLLALENKDKIEEMERRLVGTERTERTERTGRNGRNRRFPKRAAKGRLLKL